MNPYAKTCFVISPIGDEGTETYRVFRRVLEVFIKPAIDHEGWKYQVIRADDICRPGSFLKDIVMQLWLAPIVVADLTGQNPNVLYELGIRHALAPGTIMIARSKHDIPVDLLGYRTVFYGEKAEQVVAFQRKFKKYIRAITSGHPAADSPVLEQMDGRSTPARRIRKTNGAPPPAVVARGTSGLDGNTISRRCGRILDLLGIQHGMWLEWKGKPGAPRMRLPDREGSFDIHHRFAGTREYFYYIARSEGPVNWQEALADARVLMHKCSSLPAGLCSFVIVSREWLGPKVKVIRKSFKRIPGASRFRLLIWDVEELQKLERRHRLR